MLLTLHFILNSTLVHMRLERRINFQKNAPWHTGVIFLEMFLKNHSLIATRRYEDNWEILKYHISAYTKATETETSNTVKERGILSEF